MFVLTKHVDGGWIVQKDEEERVFSIEQDLMRFLRDIERQVSDWVSSAPRAKVASISLNIKLVD